MTASIHDVSDKSFDYIIVGGGTAGLTLAARLTEDEAVSVLVCEAGEANLDLPDILRPASFGTHFANPTYSWQHKWTKQEYANGRQSVWQRGKGLGGSSGINFLCWLKPPAADIDDLERLGNPGWNWTNYEKFLERTEGFIEPSGEVQTRVGLNTSDWKVGRQVSHKRSNCCHDTQTFLNAGFLAARRPISGDPTGYFLTPNTYDPNTHTRSYAATAFDLPNQSRKNLTVIVAAPVRRVLSKTSASGEVTVTGIEFEYNGNLHQANTNKEVIVSAGAIQSPHLLEQSGIGRLDVLKKANIPVALSLPGVGENLQEHLFIALSYELKDDVEWETLDLLRDSTFTAEQLKLHTQGKGVFTSGIVGFGYVPLEAFTSKAEQLYKAMQEIVANVDSKTATPGILEQFKINLERFKPDSQSHGAEFICVPGFLSSPNPPAPGKRYVTILPALNHAWSRGTVHSVSSDPKESPEIDPHYFEQGVDLDVLVEGVKFVREKFATTAPFKDMIVCEHNPGPEVRSDKDLRDWIKASFSTTWHTCGTCSMLPKDKNGVVDHNLKVYGTNNLRVVDLSILPLHIAAHTQATVYAIAEQAADIIKGKFSA